VSGDDNAVPETPEDDDLGPETKAGVERFHEWLKLALEYAEREHHEDLVELIEENPNVRSYMYLLVLQHKALLAERVRVEAQALEQFKQQESHYFGELLRKGEELEREKSKVRDLLRGADVLPTTEDRPRRHWWRRVLKTSRDASA
jgi:hypothetical protein